MPSAQATKRGTRKLSEVARHLVLPAGIVSTGYPDVRLQCSKMGIEHDEWQAGLGRAMLAKRSNGLYAAGIGGIIISISRQVGKTFTVGSIIFALCILFPGLKVLWTAHRSRTSDETFKSMQGMARRKLVAPHIESVRQANGQQEIAFKNGSRILFGARESGFGRGFDDVDIEVFDEAQILTEKALDDMVPATNVSPNPLIIFIGTPPKPTDPSEVFAGRRRETLAARAADPHAEGVGDTLLVEISADRDADVNDREQWRKGNPSYPHRTPEASILRMKKILGDDSFRREGLGIWDEDAVGGAFPASVWARAAAGSGERITTPPVVCLDVRTGLQQSYAIVAAGASDSEHDLVAVSRYVNDGSRWTNEDIVTDTVEVLRARGLNTIVLDKYGENAHLRPLFEEDGVEVVLLDTTDMRSGVVGFVDGVLNGGIKHLQRDPFPMTEAVKGAVIRNNLWSWQHSSSDLTTLRAATAAWWAYKAGEVEPDYDVSSSVF